MILQLLGVLVFVGCMVGLAVSYVREWRMGLPEWARRKRRRR